ncbi:MAG: cyclic nucleotide-binding domain-containing protein [Spirochaetales bacterium]|nr:cyclic nucleotide-binding domain-containing protein [Spirochaetales bacterium]
MSPKAIQYRTNSIIFFKGDISDKVYILNSGKVSLNYIDIETGQEVHDLIKTGEFFGVKSAFGRYPREETAVVLQDSAVIAFSVPEFEQLISKNTRIIMKMLKVFSNQLRRIHKQVQNLLYAEEQVNPETGLFRIGEYYLTNKKYNQALYAYKQYLVYYPSGVHSAEATKKIETAEEFLQKYGQGKGPAGSGQKNKAVVDKPQKTKELSNVAQSYYNAVSLISQQKYEPAYSEFKKIIEQGNDEEYLAKSQFEMGRCLFFMQKYQDCINSFTNLIQKYPTHPDLKDALFFVGKCYQALGDSSKAEGFYKKIMSMTSEEEPLYRKVKKALRTVKESN